MLLAVQVVLHPLLGLRLELVEWIEVNFVFAGVDELLADIELLLEALQPDAGPAIPQIADKAHSVWIGSQLYVHSTWCRW